MPSLEWSAWNLKHLSGTAHFFRLLALLTNIRLGWKSLPGTSTLVYWVVRKIRRKWSVLNTSPSFQKFSGFKIWKWVLVVVEAARFWLECHLQRRKDSLLVIFKQRINFNSKEKILLHVSHSTNLIYFIDKHFHIIYK